MGKSVRYLVLIGLVAASLTGLTAKADDSEGGSNMKMPTDIGGASKADGADKVDEMLTNANLRAMSGSTSVLSFASSFNYDGGTLSNPLGQQRPNIANASATSTNTDLNGQLNIKYNIDAFNGVFLGFGVRKMAPFSMTGPSADYTQKGGKDVDAYNPTVTFQHIYKWAGIQSVAQFSIMDYTQADSVASGYGVNYSFDQENIYEIGKTGASVGASIGIATNSFLKTSAALDPYQSLYQVWFDPYFEYKINDTMNFRTVLDFGNYELYKTAATTTPGNTAESARDFTNAFHLDTVIQSIGVGFSINKDFFVYPNFQFRPDQFRFADTNVGMSTTLNLF